MPKNLTTYPLPSAATLGEACEATARQLLADTIQFHEYIIQTSGGALTEVRTPVPGARQSLPSQAGTNTSAT